MTDCVKKSKAGTWLGYALILAVAYFSQVYPYVHFHHADHERGSSFELSLHPIDVEPDLLPKHHDHHHHDHHSQADHQHAETTPEPESKHHHHHEFERHVDWCLLRTDISNVDPSRNTSFAITPTVCSQTDTASSIRAGSDDTLLPESIPIRAPVSRAPPALV